MSLNLIDRIKSTVQEVPQKYERALTRIEEFIPYNLTNILRGNNAHTPIANSATLIGSAALGLGAGTISSQESSPKQPTEIVAEDTTPSSSMYDAAKDFMPSPDTLDYNKNLPGIRAKKVAEKPTLIKLDPSDGYLPTFKNDKINVEDLLELNDIPYVKDGFDDSKFKHDVLFSTPGYEKIGKTIVKDSPNAGPLEAYVIVRYLGNEPLVVTGKDCEPKNYEENDIVKSTVFRIDGSSVSYMNVPGATPSGTSSSTVDKSSLDRVTDSLLKERMELDFTLQKAKEAYDRFNDSLRQVIEKNNLKIGEITDYTGVCDTTESEGAYTPSEGSSSRSSRRYINGIPTEEFGGKLGNNFHVTGQNKLAVGIFYKPFKNLQLNAGYNFGAVDQNTDVTLEKELEQSKTPTHHYDIEGVFTSHGPEFSAQAISYVSPHVGFFASMGTSLTNIEGKYVIDNTTEHSNGTINTEEGEVQELSEYITEMDVGIGMELRYGPVKLTGEINQDFTSNQMLIPGVNNGSRLNEGIKTDVFKADPTTFKLSLQYIIK